ncbi:hypothetical protein GGI24_002002, partial [Coemansia furcata]
MRLFTYFAVSLAAANAFQLRPLVVQDRDQVIEPDTCPIDTISCQRTDVDPCCSPKHGLLVLSQQWDTRWGPSDAFTVHGLWPDTCSGKMLPSAGCDPARAYTNISSIIEATDRALLSDLNTYWPSNKGDNNWFWTHEW